MTFEKMKFLSTGKTYVEISGMSSEAKPTGYAEGSMFYETDTNKTFAFDGAEWKQTNVSDGQGGGIASDMELHGFAIPNEYGESIMYYGVAKLDKLPKSIRIVRTSTENVETDIPENSYLLDSLSQNLNWFTNFEDSFTIEECEQHSSVSADAFASQMGGDAEMAQLLKDNGMESLYMASEDTAVTYQYYEANPYTGDGSIRVYGTTISNAITLWNPSTKTVFIMILELVAGIDNFIKVATRD